MSLKHLMGLLSGPLASVCGVQWANWGSGPGSQGLISIFPARASSEEAEKSHFTALLPMIFLGTRGLLSYPSKGRPGALSTAQPPRSPPSRGPRARPPCRWSGWGDCGISLLASGEVSAGGGSMTQSQWACPHPPGTPPPTCPSPTRDSAEHRDSLLKGAGGLL